MSQKTLNTRIQHKHDTEANWKKATNFIPLQGEIIVYDADDYNSNQRFKIGDGVTVVSNLPFAVRPIKEIEFSEISGSDLHYLTGVTFADGTNSDGSRYIFNEGIDKKVFIGGGTGGDLHADKFIGSEFTGTAAKANSDSVGNQITSTYETKDDASVKLEEAKAYAETLGLPIVTTTGNGATYAAAVPGITNLTAGACFIMIPHVNSNTPAPGVNVNGLGRYLIRRPVSTTSGGAGMGSTTDWIKANYPLLLMYNGMFWLAINLTQPAATDLSGTVVPANGGTGLDTLTAGSYLVGNGTEAVSLKTPAEVLADIGAISEEDAKEYTDELAKTVIKNHFINDNAKMALNPVEVLGSYTTMPKSGDMVYTVRGNVYVVNSIDEDNQTVNVTLLGNMAPEPEGGEVLITVEDIDTICNGTFQYVDATDEVF